MLKIFTIAILIFLLIPFNISASNNIEIKYIDNVYSNRIVDGEKISGKLGYIYINNQLSFCIDPLKIVGNNYEINDAKINEYYNEEEQRILKLIIHYGVNTHLDNNYYYMATQELIWRIKGNGDFYFTDSNGEKIDIEIYKKEIIDNVIKHDLLPSFSNITLNPKLYDEIILTDNNKVINNYFISNPGTNIITKKQDSIIININDNIPSNIELTYPVSSGISSHTYVGNGQTLITSRLEEQKTTYVHIEPSGVSYYLKIKFLEGNKSIFGKVKFKIYNHNTSQYIEDGTIFESDMFGSFTSNFKLDLGTYEIAYIDIPNGYIPSTLPNKFILNEKSPVNNKLKYEFISYLEVPKGKLTINRTATMYDSSIKKLDGIEYKIFARNNISDVHGNLLYKQNELIDTIKVQNGSGEVLLPLGSYYIEEQQNNYDIEQPITHYVTFTYKDSITDIYYHEININTPLPVLNFNINTLKETIGGDYINYDGYMYELYALEDVIYFDKIVFSKGEYITTFISNNDGNIIDHLELPYGKYRIKEINIDNDYYGNDDIIFEFTRENNFLDVIIKKQLKRGNLEIIINSEKEDISNLIYFIYDEQYTYNINNKLLIENIKIGEYKVIYDKEYNVIIIPNDTTILEINIKKDEHSTENNEEEDNKKENNDDKKETGDESKENVEKEEIDNKEELSDNNETIKDDNNIENNNDSTLNSGDNENNQVLPNEKLDDNNSESNNNDEINREEDKKNEEEKKDENIPSDNEVYDNKQDINESVQNNNNLIIEENNIEGILPNTNNYFKKWYSLFNCLIIFGLILYVKKN